MGPTQHAPNCLLSKHWKHVHQNELYEQAHFLSSSSWGFAVPEYAFVVKVKYFGEQISLLFSLLYLVFIFAFYWLWLTQM